MLCTFCVPLVLYGGGRIWSFVVIATVSSLKTVPIYIYNFFFSLSSSDFVCAATIFPLDYKSVIHAYSVPHRATQFTSEIKQRNECDKEKGASR